MAVGARLTAWLLRALLPRADAPLVDGLDAQTARMLRIQGRLRSVDRMSVTRARRLERFGHQSLGRRPHPIANVRDLTIAGAAGDLRVRLYVPDGASRALLVYFHGGGGVIGSVDSYDAVTRALADGARCHVASIDYRLAPEHPHPAAVDDALAAWRWACGAAAELGVDRLAVGGDSFGGYLAAHVAARAEPRRPALQLLVYPILDLTHASPSLVTHGEGRLLTRAIIDWFDRHVQIPDDDRVRFSPGLSPSLSGLPPALVVTAGFDPLVDEGRAHAERLAAAGVEVTHLDYPTLIHGFLGHAGVIATARTAADEIAATVGRALADPAPG